MDLGSKSRYGRLAVAAIVAAVALTVTGCGAGTQAGTVAPRTAGQVTLTLKHLSDNRPALTKLIAAYRRVAPNVTINASYAGVDELQTTLRAQIGGGNAPDLFIVWPGNGSAMSVHQLAAAGVLADLSDDGWIEHVPPNLRPLLGDRGKTYMYSSGVTPIGAIYNRDVFAAARIAAPPRTWSELLADCERIKAQGVACIALGTQTPWVTQLIPYAIAPSTAFKDDPDLAQEMLAGTKTFSSSGWRTVFERYLELQRRDDFNDHPNGTTFEQQQALVASGKAAMAVQVTTVATGIRSAARDPSAIASFVFPAADRARDLKIAAGVSAGVGASAVGGHLAEAKRFIDFLAEPRNMAIYAAASHSIPLAGAGTAELDDIVAPFAPFVADGRTVPFMDQQWPNAEVQPAHFAAVQDLLAGRTDVDGLLKRLDEAYQQQH